MQARKFLSRGAWFVHLISYSFWVMLGFGLNFELRLRLWLGLELWLWVWVRFRVGNRIKSSIFYFSTTQQQALPNLQTCYTFCFTVCSITLYLVDYKTSSAYYRKELKSCHFTVTGVESSTALQFFLARQSTQPRREDCQHEATKNPYTAKIKKQKKITRDGSFLEKFRSKLVPKGMHEIRFHSYFKAKV